MRNLRFWAATGDGRTLSVRANNLRGLEDFVLVISDRSDMLILYEEAESQRLSVVPQPPGGFYWAARMLATRSLSFL
jgi:hypothetical protein